MDNIGNCVLKSMSNVGQHLAESYRLVEAYFGTTFTMTLLYRDSAGVPLSVTFKIK